VSALRFEVVGSGVERYAAVPTINLRLRIEETTGTPVHAVALRAQVRIEPQRRNYDDHDAGGLAELFGERARWGESLRPFLWLHVATMVGAFTGSTEVDLPLACTYDLEVTATKYLRALGDGEVPLLLLFSGTTFSKPPAGTGGAPAPTGGPAAGSPSSGRAQPTSAGATTSSATGAGGGPTAGGVGMAAGPRAGFVAEPVTWNEQATYRMPVAVWRDLIDRYFPNSAWLRLGRDTVARLERFKVERALPTWDLALEQLLKEAGEAP
jgi:hypothetical protein